MIELTLTNKQARKIIRALDGPSATDPDIAGVYAHLDRWLKVADGRREKLAPWRKVVKNEGYGQEILECGHSYRLRTTRDWTEDHAKKRRCLTCAKRES